MTDTQPLVTILLTSYNHQDTINSAIEAALAQTYSPLEIIISDDCSSDATWEHIQAAIKTYQGPHKIRLNHNEQNMGIGVHLSYLANLAQGELLFVAAGDDISLPQRCERIVDYWIKNGRCADLISCDLIDMHYDGTCVGTLHSTNLANYHSLQDWINERPYIVGAGHTWHRRLFEKFGPMAYGIRMEDQVMVLRAILAGGAISLPEALVRYRRGGESGRRRTFSSADQMARWAYGSQFAINEMQQSIRDAELVELGTHVSQYFAPTLAREQYIQAMHNTSSYWRRVQIFLHTTKVSLRWRFRVFAHTNLSALTAIFFLVKRVVALLKNQ